MYVNCTMLELCPDSNYQCINQANAEEKLEQIMQMAEIYGAAHVTLVAAAGTGPEHGLPGVQPGSRDMLKYCETLGPILFIPVPHWNLHWTLKASTWASRAW
jgi:hypothetical protein